MVGYPNKRSTSSTPSKKIEYGRRGMPLEDDLNATNRYYLDIDRAAIYKKPIPVQIVKVDYKSRQTAKIVEAYYQTPSTTDYNGIYQGRYIDFEAKETHSSTSMPMNIVHPHQFEHLRRVLRYGGIAFMIIRFVAYDETYYVPAGLILELYDGGAKTIKHQWFKDSAYLIPYRYNLRIDYLSIIDKLYPKEK